MRSGLCWRFVRGGIVCWGGSIYNIQAFALHALVLHVRGQRPAFRISKTVLAGHIDFKVSPALENCKSLRRRVVPAEGEGGSGKQEIQALNHHVIPPASR
jgi:hypothetical protein